MRLFDAIDPNLNTIKLGVISRLLFVLSLSKHERHHADPGDFVRSPFDKLRANGEGLVAMA
jgi:hypothetical protein